MDPVLLSLVIGGGLILASMGKKKKRKAPAPEPEPEPEPGEPGGIAGSDAKMLKGLGYPVSKSGVRTFQQDFNLVQKAFSIWDRTLKVDGLLGANTRGALARAEEYVNNQGKSWAEIVAAAKEKLAKYKLTANDRGNLQSLGYSIDETVVARFQRDFNLVNLAVDEPLVPMTLVEDGLIGPNTREAIAAAQQAQIDYSKSWPTLVGEMGGQVT